MSDRESAEDFCMGEYGVSDECRFDKGVCLTHVRYEPIGGGYNVGADAGLCKHAAAALQAKVQARSRSWQELEGELARLRDLPICRLQLPDGSVPGGTEEALSAWYRLAMDLRKQKAELEQQFQQHIMTHAAALLQMGEKLARAQGINQTGQATSRLSEIEESHLQRHHDLDVPNSVENCETCYLLNAASDLHSRLSRAEQAMRTLESLTPGGSEYIGDAERCATFIRESRQHQHDTIIKFKRELNSAEQAVGRLREALDVQYLAGVEWGIKQLSKREDWPQSWDAGFPGFKGQALIDRGSVSAALAEGEGGGDKETQ